MSTETFIKHEHFTMLCEVLYDDEARQAGIVNDVTDVRMCAFFNKVWRDPYLQRWLCASNVAGSPVSETHYLNLLGWMQNHDFFADGITKTILAEYLTDHLPITREWQVSTLQKCMSERFSPKIVDRLMLLVCK